MITAVRSPDSVAAAVIHAVAGGRIMAGGTVVMAQVNDGSAAASELVSLRRAGLSGIAFDGTNVSAGAATTLAEVEECARLAFLGTAVRSIGLTEEAATELVRAVQEIRALPLLKRPGIAETVDWARGATALAEGGAGWPLALRRALGLLIKDEESTALVHQRAGEVFGHQ